MAEPSAFISNTGKDSVGQDAVRPRRTFKASFDHRTNNEYQVLIDFFESMQASVSPFQWTEPASGVVYTMRFSGDDYEVVYEDEAQSSPIGQLSFMFVECPINVVPSTLTVRLLADSSLI
jgi:hypothetical protein